MKIAFFLDCKNHSPAVNGYWNKHLKRKLWTVNYEAKKYFIGLFLSLIDFDTLRLNDNAVSASVHEAQPLGLNALDLSQKMG